MFVLYEFMGIMCNLFGGVIGANQGMQRMFLYSFSMQLIGLVCLCLVEQLDFSDRIGVTIYVVFCQGWAGCAKDFTKLAGKSVPKLVTPEGQEGALFRIVARLTGMKNSFKGMGYFIGAVLIYSGIGFVGALVIMMVLILSLFWPVLKYMDTDIGQSASTNRILSWAVFQKSANVNVLCLARLLLFGARDVWFEISTPIFLKQVLLWEDFATGAFMAGYIIVYGYLQASTTQLFKKQPPGSRSVVVSISMLSVWTLGLGLALYFSQQDHVATTVVLIVGLFVYACLFAVNSSVHSYLIVSYSDGDKVSMDLGFYYMANAGGRLIGTLLGGLIYTFTVDEYGISPCLFASFGFLAMGSVVSLALKDEDN